MKKVVVVGIGPGDESMMTMEASEALEHADVIAGYKLYVEQVRPKWPDKEFIVNGMRQETERCRLALEAANSGKCTAVVCSGDAGVYGMAGLVLELSVDFPEVEVSVVPGVTAALSGGAVLGAPLGHDFAVISLSDLLTPWELITKRLRAAGASDLCICLYNPSSHGRKDYLKKACAEILKGRSEVTEHPEETVCGYVRQIGRDGTTWGVMTLRELADFEADMLTTVFIGNTMTKNIGGRMVTPRGYRK